MSITGATLNASGPANPCGMVAYTIFNDTFQMLYPNGSNVSTMTTDGIAWPSDVKRYKNSNPA
mgnify:CR=1 FL=1